MMRIQRKLRLTQSNYYSPETDQQYFSVSQYKDFMKCEAMAMAKLRGEYKPAMTRAMLTGSFVDSYFEGTLDLFINEHPAVFTQKQELRSEFKNKSGRYIPAVYVGRKAKDYDLRTVWVSVEDEDGQLSSRNLHY